jgi:hypothetical protein
MLKYNQSVMRKHYNDCLKNTKFTSFPSETLLRKNIRDNDFYIIFTNIVFDLKNFFLIKNFMFSNNFFRKYV